MAKKITQINSINISTDLVTSRVQTRAGFISMALEKNYIAIPYVEEAKSLKLLASNVKKPQDLLQMSEVRVGLLTASGLSDKAMKYLTEADKTVAIEEFIEKFLEPANKDFANELVYRYLLTKGDALGGKARNLAGLLGERKFLRSLLSAFSLAGIQYRWKDEDSNSWLDMPDDDAGIEKRIKCLSWTWKNKNRILIMNMKVPLVNNNVDLSVLEGTIDDLKKSKYSIIHQPDRYIALGELKGGIDPAGADEHWKTANSALNRIRTSFLKKKLKPQTFFVGAAIENAMAFEIFNLLQKGTLSNAANLTNDSQLVNLCNWLIKI